MKNAHMALHLSKKLSRKTIVIQPRRIDGTFQSPIKLGSSVVTSFHTTVDGQVILR